MFVAIFILLVYNYLIMIRIAEKCDENFISQRLKSNPYMRAMHNAGVGTAYVHDGAVLILSGTVLHTTEHKPSEDTLSFSKMVAEKLCYPSRSGLVFSAKKCNGENGAECGFLQARQAYQVLCDCGELSNLSFEEFYVNIQKGLEKKTRHIAICHENEKPVSVAMTLFETSGHAYISGVATLNDYRGQGYATRALSLLCEQLGGKTAYALYEKSLSKFYEKNGFEKIKSYKIDTVER